MDYYSNVKRSRIPICAIAWIDIKNCRLIEENIGNDFLCVAYTQ